MAEELDPWIEELLKQSDADEKMTDKQRRIVKAAVEIFAEKGYAATSTSEIAQKAGVAEGTIFRHYKTKKELLISIVAPLMAKLIAPFVIKNFDSVFDDEYAKMEDFLRAVIVNRIDFARKNMKLIKILLQEIPFQPELKEPFIEYVEKGIFERFAKVVEFAQKRGEIIPLPPARILRLAASTIIGFLAARLILFPEAEWNDEEEIEATIQFIMHGIAAKKD